jgi:hypothetical protein
MQALALTRAFGSFSNFVVNGAVSFEVRSEGKGPTGTVAMTVFVVVSITDTLLEPKFAM